VGVYGSAFDNFPISRWFDKGVTLLGTQAPVQIYIDHLMRLVQEGKVTLNDIITHTLPLVEATHGYDIFKKKKTTA